MINPFLKSKQARRRINSTDVLLRRMRTALLAKVQRTNQAPIYSVAGRLVSPDVVENAISSGAIVPRDRGLFENDAGNSQTFILNLSRFSRG